MPSTDPLYQLNFDGVFGAERCPILKRAVTTVLKERHAGERKAAQLLLEAIGVRHSFVANESRYAQALDYTLALTLAFLNEPEQASKLIDRLGSPPGPGGNLLFSDHVALSMDLFARQEAALKRGIPSFLIAAMPRSASTFLTRTISALLDIPVVRLSLLGNPDHWLMRQWVNGFTPGGAITHDHFSANGFNLETLSKCGVRNVFVLIRDPRACCVSAATMRLGANSNQDGFVQYANKLFTDTYAPWIPGWVSATKTSPTLKVNWIFHSDLRSDPSRVIREMLESFCVQYPALRSFLEVAPPVISSNFNHGDDNRWRDSIPIRTQREWWKVLTGPVIDLLQLEV